MLAVDMSRPGWGWRESDSRAHENWWLQGSALGRSLTSVGSGTRTFAHVYTCAHTRTPVVLRKAEETGVNQQAHFSPNPPALSTEGLERPAGRAEQAQVPAQTLAGYFWAE